MAAGFQRQGTGNAEVGEKHFPQFGPERFFAGSKGQRHVPQAQTLQGAGPGFLRLQADQDGGGREHGVAQRFGEAVQLLREKLDRKNVYYMNPAMDL